MTETSLETKIYECPSPSHLEEEKNLRRLKFQLNGHYSPYFFCSPCNSLYELRDGALNYVDKDELENIPILSDEYDKRFDPLDLIEEKER